MTRGGVTSGAFDAVVVAPFVDDDDEEGETASASSAEL